MLLSSAFNNAPHKDSLGSALSHYAYPSPSLSPATLFHATMDSLEADNRRRSSVKCLMSQANPPATSFDALVMALEATAEELQGGLEDAHPRRETPIDLDLEAEDPNATVPSSPTVFMKKSGDLVDAPSLHQLPSLLLPESVVSTQAHLPPTSSEVSFPPSPVSPTLPLSTFPDQMSPLSSSPQRKMSVCSQSSVSSSGSNSERTKSFACMIGNCQKKFYQVAHLRIHERCHTGTRPFVCRYDGCERSFTQLGNLKTHERKHTGERPFKCHHPGCDKTFTQLGNLKTHERIHDEVKPFMCRLPGCGKTFSQLGNLKTHTAKLHPDMALSDEELSTKSPATRTRQSSQGLPDNKARDSQSPERGAVQVVAHFNPYQRRPIRPQRSEEDVLLKEIRAMIQYQERVRQLSDGSDLSDEMDH
ncbi:hypothetical protein BGX33_000033 [Mortierella sp. NVP41]|nr:hypothetical protein BGX33_000033 [Mortierella sp. NVP41]